VVMTNEPRTSFLPAEPAMGEV